MIKATKNTRIRMYLDRYLVSKCLSAISRVSKLELVSTAYASTLPSTSLRVWNKYLNIRTDVKAIYDKIDLFAVYWSINPVFRIFGSVCPGTHVRLSEYLRSGYPDLFGSPLLCVLPFHFILKIVSSSELLTYCIQIVSFRSQISQRVGNDTMERLVHTFSNFSYGNLEVYQNIDVNYTNQLMILNKASA